MSYFTGETSTTGSDQITDQNEGNLTTDDFVKMVVEEKGEQWNNPQALAKGYIHAQKRIKELEDIQKELDKQDYAKQLLEELRNKGGGATPTNDGVNKPSGAENEKTTPSSVDIQSLINETLTTREKENTAKQNLIKADQELSKLFGTEASKVVDSRAKELGLSKDKLSEIASESPSAFLRLIGEAPTKETNQSFNNSVNTESGKFTQNGQRTQKYYQELRRTNRALYHSPSTQEQMMKDRLSLGDKFYA